MPELPEVETSRRGIEPYLVGHKIHHSVVRFPKLRWVIPSEIVNLKDEVILSVQRRAKYLLVELETGWIVIHLGMSGSLRILLTPTEAQKHDHVDLVMDNGVTLRYTDPRRFGAWLWCHHLSDCEQLKNLGPEPLSSEFNADDLYKRSRGKRTAIKAWIMDNHVVVGVGNIYACESLFAAGILPSRACGSLSLQEFTELVAVIKRVLTKSIEQGGTTLKDFLQADGKPGYFAQELQVYGRYGQPCHQSGPLISTQRIGQRNTFYCPYCQR